MGNIAMARFIGPTRITTGAPLAPRCVRASVRK